MTEWGTVKKVNLLYWVKFNWQQDGTITNGISWFLWKSPKTFNIFKMSNHWEKLIAFSINLDFTKDNEVVSMISILWCYCIYRWIRQTLNTAEADITIRTHTACTRARLGPDMFVHLVITMTFPSSNFISSACSSLAYLATTKGQEKGKDLCYFILTSVSRSAIPQVNNYSVYVIYAVSFSFLF